MEWLFFALFPAAAIFSGWQFASFPIHWQKKQGCTLYWPGLLSLALAGIALCNFTVILWWGKPLVYTPSGFLWNAPAIYYNVILLLFSLPGVFRYYHTFQPCWNQKSPSPLYFFWAWSLSHGVLAAFFLLLSNTPIYAPSLKSVFTLLLLLTLLFLGALFGSRWGRPHSPVIPLLGLVLLCAASAFLVRQMSLWEYPMDVHGFKAAGFWFARLCLPSRVLLDWWFPSWDGSYAIMKQPLPVLACALLPPALFTIGYLFPLPFKRGFDHAKHHLKN